MDDAGPKPDATTTCAAAAADGDFAFAPFGAAAAAATFAPFTEAAFGAAAAAAADDADVPDDDVPDDDILDADVPDDDILDADVLDADVPDDDILDADVPDADVPDADVPDDDDLLLPNNAPVCAEATFFFPVNQPLNFAPIPFLDDAGGVEAAVLTDDEGAFFLVNQPLNFAPIPFLDDDADADADDLDADVLDADVPDADDLLPNNTPVCAEATFFFLVNKLRNPAPNPFLGDADTVLDDPDAVEAAELTDDDGAFFLALQVATFLKPAAATNIAFALTPLKNPFLGDEGGVPDADDDILPNNTPLCAEATFFFLVNQPRNPAPNPFLGDADTVLDDPDAVEAAELTDDDGAFFLALQVATFLKPAAATNIAFALTPLKNPFLGDEGGVELCLVDADAELVECVDLLLLDASLPTDGVDGSLAPFALASAIAFAAAFAFFASLHETNLSLPFTSKSLVPLPIYLAPLVRAYKAGAPFLSFSSSAELVRECLLLLGFLRPNFIAISSSSSLVGPFLYFDDLDGVDGSVPNDDQEGGDDSGESSGDLLLRLPVDLDITDNSSLSSIPA